jgi:uncharacterized protein YycO
MPHLGAFMVTPTGGWFAKLIRKVTHSKVNHAAVYVGAGFIVEAEPHGARVHLASHYPNAIWSEPPISVHTQLAIIHAALDLVGTPYNYLDILAQFLVRSFNWKAPKWALKRISDPSRLQCAQLVDVAYDKAGVKLFADGRPNGLVAPSDLLLLIEQEKHG